MSTLKVAILWHFHQPSYWDPQHDHYRYPWVFLHTARHYHSMAVIAARHPEARVAFNFTPVLTEQLDHYAAEEHPKDRILSAILKPAEDLSRHEVDLLLDHVFNLNVETMIRPFPRYRQLHGILAPSPGGRRPRVGPRDLRDLQTLYLLTWTGPALRAGGPVRELVEKERDFSESDKEALYAAMRGAIRETCSLYGAMHESGQIEITTTPYYHPILPLVIDVSSARESRPDVDLEGIEFHHPEDARWHVREAISSCRERFHADPCGVWPAEGSVSDAALRMMAESGFRWAGTDEGILARSLGSGGLTPAEKHRPYRFADTDLWVYFRDREISDRIGFVYSGWRPEEAVADLLGRFLSIRDQLPAGSTDACVTVILDGENPWEYYRDSGVGFLDGLYEGLATTPGLEAMRFKDHRETSAPAPVLRHVVPGSWIGANFDTWIGCREKNHAWKVLAAARRTLALEAPEKTPPREFYRAEGSDWFWWLGPGHDTPYEASYENIFRINLRRGLEKAGLGPPAILEEEAALPSTPLLQHPTHLVTPRIDGSPGNYYDWIAAGHVLASEGSFHRIHRHLERVRFGFDLDHLYLRIEGELEGLADPQLDLRVEIVFQRPERDLRLIYTGGGLRILEREGKERPFHGTVAHGVFLEAAIPFTDISPALGDARAPDAGAVIEFAVRLVSDGNPAHSIEAAREIDRLPQSGSVVIRRPGPDFGLENWSA